MNNIKLKDPVRVLATGQTGTVGGIGELLFTPARYMVVFSHDPDTGLPNRYGWYEPDAVEKI